MPPPYATHADVELHRIRLFLEANPGVPPVNIVTHTPPTAETGMCGHCGRFAADPDPALVDAFLARLAAGGMITEAQAEDFRAAVAAGESGVVAPVPHTGTAEHVIAGTQSANGGRGLRMRIVHCAVCAGSHPGCTGTDAFAPGAHCHAEDEAEDTSCAHCSP